MYYQSFKRQVIFVLSSAFSFFLFVVPAHAVCPVCTIAVAAGVGLSRYLGIDDSITGLWIGGLCVSITLWTISWLEKKNIRFDGRNLLTWIGYFVLVVVPLYWGNFMGHPLNVITIGNHVVDKLLLGIGLGAGLFYAGVISYEYIKAKNGNKAHFPFQKIAMPIVPLIILSFLFYFLTKR